MNIRTLFLTLSFLTLLCLSAFQQSPALQAASQNKGPEDLVQYDLTLFPEGDVPELMMLTPDEAVQGSTVGVTITGYATHFMSGTLTIDLGAGIDITNVNVMSNTEVTADLMVGMEAMTGAYTLTTKNEAETLLMANAFTVTPKGDMPKLMDMTPNEGVQGSTVNVKITGHDTHFMSGTLTIDLGAGIDITNVNVTSDTEATADLMIGMEAMTGAYTLTTTNEAETLVLANAFTVTPKGDMPKLMDMTPNEGVQGNTVGVKITGHETHFMNGALTIDLGAGINVTNVNVMSDTEATADLMIGMEAMTGAYTLTTTNEAETLVLANAFTVKQKTMVPGPMIYIDPMSATVMISDTHMITVMVDPGSIAVNGAQVNLQLDPTYLQVLHIQKVMSHLNEVLLDVDFDPETGILQYGAGLLNGTISVPFPVLVLETKAVSLTGDSGTQIVFRDNFPATDISAPSGSVMETAKDGVVYIVEDKDDDDDDDDGGNGENVTMHGRVELQDRPARPSNSWAISLTVELIDSESMTTTTYSVSTDRYGEFELTDLMTGTYTIRVKGDHTLANRIHNVPLALGENRLSLGLLVEGDVDTINSGNAVVLGDFGQLSGSMYKCDGDEKMVANANLNESSDGCVTISDFGLLAGNYPKEGDIVYGSLAEVGVPISEIIANARLTFGQNELVVNNDEIVTVPYYIDPRGSVVNGATIHLVYDTDLVELVKVELADTALSTVLMAPAIAQESGSAIFSIGSLGDTLSQQVQVATLHLRVKAETTGTQITSVDSFPATNVVGPEGSVLAESEGLILIRQDNNVDDSDDLNQGQAANVKIFLPAIIK